MQTVMVDAFRDPPRSVRSVGLPIDLDLPRQLKSTDLFKRLVGALSECFN